MQPRIDYRKFNQEPLQHLLAIEEYVAKSGLDPKLLHLIRMRASQINGCAYCLDMHSLDARAVGESEQRLYTLEAWRETPFFSDRERAALAWTEALTLLPSRHVSDADYEAVRGIYVIDLEAMSLLPRDAIVLHPLPRVDEIRPEVDEDPRAAYFRQVANGVFVRMALLKLLLAPDF